MESINVDPGGRKSPLNMYDPGGIKYGTTNTEASGRNDSKK